MIGRSSWLHALEAISHMMDSCQELDSKISYVYLCPVTMSAPTWGPVGKGNLKASKMDQPKSNPKRADRPLQVVHLDLASICHLQDIITMLFL